MNGLSEGHGVMYYTDGNRYKGNWVKDERTGHGVIYFVNGDRYEGYFVNDKKEGHGVEYNKDGTVKRKGEWKEDEFVESK